MRTANIYMKNQYAGQLIEIAKGKQYRFEYDPNYKGEPISLTIPLKNEVFIFNEFPAFFDGLLPEGLQLESLLRRAKLDRDDYFGQLITIGKDPIGAVSIEQQ